MAPTVGRFVLTENSFSCLAVPTAEYPMNLKPFNSSNQESGLMPILSIALAVFAEINPRLSLFLQSACPGFSVLLKRYKTFFKAKINASTSSFVL